MSELQRELSVETVGYRAFDFARAFLLAEPGAAGLRSAPFLENLQLWARDADGDLPQQLLVEADQDVLIGRIRAQLLLG